MTLDVSEEVLRKARLLAEQRHCSVEAAIDQALEAALSLPDRQPADDEALVEALAEDFQARVLSPDMGERRIARRKTPEEKRRCLNAVLASIDALEIDWSFSDKDLYDENGAPIL